LKEQGINGPDSTPVYYPKTHQLIEIGEVVYALDSDCSSEAEFVILKHQGELYIGCGADVFDKKVESLEGAKSKHLYPNQISHDVWRYQDIEKNWDEIKIESWLGKGKKSLYQSKKLKDIMEPHKILDFIANKYNDEKVPDGTVVYSGTVETLIGGMPYTEYFTVSLTDETNNRTISCGFDVVKVKEDWG